MNYLKFNILLDESCMIVIGSNIITNVQGGSPPGYKLVIISPLTMVSSTINYSWLVMSTPLKNITLYCPLLMSREAVERPRDPFNSAH